MSNNQGENKNSVLRSQEEVLAEKERLVVDEFLISAEQCRERRWGRLTLLGPLPCQLFLRIEAQIHKQFSSDIWVVNVHDKLGQTCQRLRLGHDLLRKFSFDNCTTSWLTVNLPSRFALILSDNEYWDVAGDMEFLRGICPDLRQTQDDFRHDLETEPSPTFRATLWEHANENDLLCAEAGRGLIK